MGLAIFYLLYLFFKVIGIIGSLLGSPDLAQKKPTKVKSIISGEKNYMNKNSSDHLNVEKLDDENQNQNQNDNEDRGEDFNRENEENENNDNNEEAKNDNES